MSNHCYKMFMKLNYFNAHFFDQFQCIDYQIYILTKINKINCEIVLKFFLESIFIFFFNRKLPLSFSFYIFFMAL